MAARLSSTVGNTSSSSRTCASGLCGARLYKTMLGPRWWPRA